MPNHFSAGNKHHAASFEDRHPRLVAGFFAVLTFHQGLWVVLYQIGMIPSDLPAWPMNPIPPSPRLYYALLFNAAWGFGTALFLRLEHVRPAHSRAKHDQLT